MERLLAVLRRRANILEPHRNIAPDFRNEMYWKGFGDALAWVMEVAQEKE